MSNFKHSVGLLRDVEKFMGKSMMNGANKSDHKLGWLEILLCMDVPYAHN